MEHITIPSAFDSLELGAIVIKAENPKAIVQIAHGMCEHKERYIPFMEYLASNGYSCICHDHRGHGESVKSPDDLGYMYSGGWKALVDDCYQVSRYAENAYPGLPLYLFGHSMGSMVVRSYAKRHDSCLKGLFVCGCPAYNPAAPVGKVLAHLLGAFSGGHNRPKLLQSMSFGSFNKPFAAEGPNAWVCSDLQARAKYNADPLCQFQFTSNGFENLLGLMLDCYEDPSKGGWNGINPELPIRFLSGGDDPCRGSDQALNDAVRLMQRAGYRDVTLKTYPGLRHEILNETTHLEVWNDVLRELEGME